MPSRDRGRRRARVCLEQRCPCVVVLVGGCFSVGFMASLTTIFQAHDENFDFSTSVRDFVTVERYADAFACPCRACWIFFWHPLKRQLTWCLSLACIGVVALAWMCRVTPPRYIMSDFVACGKFSPARRKSGARAVCWGTRVANHLGSASSWKTLPCGKDVLPSIRQSAWSTVEKDYFFSMQQRKAHLQCKCSWHAHTGTLVTHAAPSRSQTSRGTLLEAGTMTKKLLLHLHASLSFFFFCYYKTSRYWKTSSSSSRC